METNPYEPLCVTEENLVRDEGWIGEGATGDAVGEPWVLMSTVRFFGVMVDVFSTLTLTS